MAEILSKKLLVRKAMQVGGSTTVSRLLGFAREALLMNYLSIGVLSDAFLTAFMIPNALRGIFAEGALSAAFVPTFIKTLRAQGKEQANSLMSTALFVFESILLVITCVAFMNPHAVISTIAPGFSQDQIERTIPLFRMLMPFIFFVSASALLAGALQSAHHFFVPAFGPVLLNVVMILGIGACLFFKLPVLYLCFFIVMGGILHLAMHIITYYRYSFSFGKITWKSCKGMVVLLGAFGMCVMSMGLGEINFLIDRSFASYLPAGSISLIYYANRFMGIPLGIFGVTISTILLPHFSRISTYAPKRLSFYLLEATKLVFWVTVPVVIMMGLFAEKIFSTLFFSASFTQARAHEAGMILIAFLLGLFFFALNKIILSIYYAFHAAVYPTIVAAIALGANVVLNYLLMQSMGATGLALATSISGLMQTILLLYFLKNISSCRLYFGPLFHFLQRAVLQCGLILGFFWCVYWSCTQVILMFDARMAHVLLNTLLFWFWIGPLSCVTLYAIFKTRHLFGIKLYFVP